jgi:hypothetical protein
VETENANMDSTDDNRSAAESRPASLIDWYSEGETRVVEIGGVRITVRFVGRKGRRGRIKIQAPGGAVFWGVDSGGGGTESRSESDQPSVPPDVRRATVGTSGKSTVRGS